jgi:hypothetical protein
MLALNLVGVALFVVGAMAMLWPCVLTMPKPLRWVGWGLALALLGFFLIRA